MDFDSLMFHRKSDLFFVLIPLGRTFFAKSALSGLLPCSVYNKNDKRELVFPAFHVTTIFPALGQISLFRPSHRGSFGRLTLYSIYYYNSYTTVIATGY